MNDGHSLYTRTISAFPISVGTSLALESLFAPRLETIDPERKFERVDVTKYSEVWINLSTLFRNIVGAVEKEVFMMATDNELLSILQSEIEIINDLFQNEGQGFCKPIYYHCSYKKLYDKLDKAKIGIRSHKTELQRSYAVKHDKTLEKLDKATDEIRKFNIELSGNSTANALMLSHVPYDLLSYKSFNNLSLLESHTGKLKNRNQWNSKYFALPTKDLSHMPFNELLLLVFGDKVQIQPSPMKLRTQIYDTSINRKWNVMTTLEKIKYDLSLDIKEPFVLAWLKSL